MTSMSYLFIKLWEVFCLRYSTWRTKVLIEEASDFLLPRISREEKLKDENFFEYTMKEPERSLPSG